MKNWTYILIIPWLLASCIGTDILEQEIFPERVEITSAADTIKVGESFQFDALFFNTTGEMEETTLSWGSLDNSIIEVTENGLATAVNPGITHVTVQAGSVIDSIEVTAGAVTVVGTNTDPRTGTFVGVNNYSVEGSFQLELVDETLVRLSFGEDFRTQSGPGLYIYLSNSASSVAGGIELGELKETSGVQSYEFDQQDLFNVYSHVIVYCKPFGVPFGVGEFTN